MTDECVVRKLEEQTDWCSSIAFSTKKYGSIGICLDPQKMNSSLKRCAHKIPTVEQLNPVFYKLSTSVSYTRKLDIDLSTLINHPSY